MKTISSMANKMANLSIEEKKRAEKTFIEVAALLQEGKGLEAMKALEANRELLFSYDPEKTLRAYFELRFLLKQFDEAYEDYAYFSSLPYVSQEIEEILRALPKLIRANELASASSKSFDEEVAHAALTDGEDPYAILGVLQQLKDRDITPFLDEIRALLSSDIHEDVKTFALLLLTEKNVDDEFLLLKKGKSYKLNPSKLGNPFQEQGYLSARKYIGTLKDSGLSSVMAQLLDQLALSSYPERIFDIAESEEFLAALEEIAYAYLGQEKQDQKHEKMRQKIEKLLETPSLMN